MNNHGRNNTDDRPTQGDSLHSREGRGVFGSEGKQDRVRTPIEDSKSNPNGRRVGKRSAKGSLRTQP